MPQASRLFAFTSWILKAGMIFCLAIVSILVLGLGALVLAEIGTIHIPIPESVTHGMPLGEVLAAGALVIAAGAICMALYALVLMLVGRIVDSAMAENPFVPKNANRLNAIGIVLLVLQGVGFFTRLAIFAMPQPLNQNLHIGFGMSLSGLFAALLVFVLAQIFHHGADMRAELEGTI